MKKKALLVLITVMILSSLFILPIVNAEVPGPVETISKVWGEYIAPLFSFEWAQGNDVAAFAAFMRFVLWIIFFAILYAVGSHIPTFAAHRTQVALVTGLLAVFMVMFIPADLLLAAVEMYSSVGALVLLGVPVFGLLYLLHATGRLPINPRARAIVNIFIIIALMIILSYITSLVDGGA